MVCLLFVSSYYLVHCFRIYTTYCSMTYIHSPLFGTSSGSSSHRGDNSEYSKRAKHSFQPKTFKVEISYAAKIPLRSISFALQGSKAEHAQDVLRVLDTILRQQASDRHF